jgi:hypothetical protein
MEILSNKSNKNTEILEDSAVTLRNMSLKEFIIVER